MSGRRYRRKSYHDVRKVGRSAVVPFNPTESVQDRHSRRLETNLEARHQMQAWCWAMGVRLEVNNEGHHWIFRRDSGAMAEWWPSSAKLVIDKQYERGIHCHDYLQVQTVLKKEWKLL